MITLCLSRVIERERRTEASVVRPWTIHPHPLDARPLSASAVYRWNSYVHVSMEALGGTILRSDDSCRLSRVRINTTSSARFLLRARKGSVQRSSRLKPSFCTASRTVKSTRWVAVQRFFLRHKLPVAVLYLCALTVIRNACHGISYPIHSLSQRRLSQVQRHDSVSRSTRDPCGGYSCGHCALKPQYPSRTCQEHRRPFVVLRADS